MEVPRQGDDCAGSPAVAVKYDARSAFLRLDELALVIGSQQVDDEAMSIIEAPILKRFDMNGPCIVLLQVVREYYRAVHRVIMANVATQKSDNDGRRWRGVHGIRG